MDMWRKVGKRKSVTQIMYVRHSVYYGVFQQKLIIVKNYVVFSTPGYSQPTHNGMII